jgi:hypothetical protein
VSGDDAWDRRCENRVLKRLKDGDTLAWFTACLSLESWSTDVLHKTYLGCCNYDTAAEFIQNQMEYLLKEAVDEFAELVLSAHDNKAA